MIGLVQSTVRLSHRPTDGNVCKMECTFVRLFLVTESHPDLSEDLNPDPPTSFVFISPVYKSSFCQPFLRSALRLPSPLSFPCYTHFVTYDSRPAFWIRYFLLWISPSCANRPLSLAIVNRFSLKLKCPFQFPFFLCATSVICQFT